MEITKVFQCCSIKQIYEWIKENNAEDYALEIDTHYESTQIIDVTINHKYMTVTI